MAGARPRRLLTIVLAAGLVLLGSAACANSPGPVTPSPSSTTSLAPATTSAGPTSAAPTASAAFPSSARLYAEAVLLAWRTNQQSRLAELVSPTVLSQLQTTTNVEPNWVYASCQGAAGSTYCQFLNGDGDAATLRLENQLVGEPHAATEVKLDLTTYSNNAVEYVKSFIEAWRNANTRRMAVLANQSEVEYFTHYTPPGTYSTCATLSGGITSVRVYNTDGLNYTLTLAVALLGGKHAITGHTATAPACT
jgi:hypothetical protein